MKQISILLEQSGSFTSLMLEFAFVICICVGFVATVVLLLQLKKRTFTHIHRRMKLTFGGWLALALEFQLSS